MLPRAAARSCPSPTSAPPPRRASAAAARPAGRAAGLGAVERLSAPLCSPPSLSRARARGRWQVLCPAWLASLQPSTQATSPRPLLQRRAQSAALRAFPSLLFAQRRHQTSVRELDLLT